MMRIADYIGYYFCNEMKVVRFDYEWGPHKEWLLLDYIEPLNRKKCLAKYTEKRLYSMIGSVLELSESQYKMLLIYKKRHKGKPKTEKEEPTMRKIEWFFKDFFGIITDGRLWLGIMLLYLVYIVFYLKYLKMTY